VIAAAVTGVVVAGAVVIGTAVTAGAAVIVEGIAVKVTEC